MKIFCATLRTGLSPVEGGGGPLAGGQSEFHGEKGIELDVKTSRNIKAMMLNPGRQRDAHWNILARLMAPRLGRVRWRCTVQMKRGSWLLSKYRNHVTVWYRSTV